MIWLLGGYMWLFIHRPFEVWPWLGDLHVERVYILATILYWAVAVDKQWVHNRLNVAFILFWFVMLASCMLSPFQSSVEDYFKLVVFYILVITSVRTERELRLLVIMFLGAMGLYLVHSLREYHCGRYMYSMGTVRMIGIDRSMGDPNSFAATVVCSLPMVLPLWFQFKNSRLRWALAGYVGLAVTCVLLTGSRMGFVGLCALVFMTVLLSKHRVKILLLLAIAAPLAWHFLPEGRQNRFLTLIDPAYGPANAQASAESRWQGWHDGVRIWKEHPVLGAGPGAFGAARGYPLASHHLYGQILGELGTLGAVAFGMVVLGFFANYLDLWRLCRQDPEFRGTFPARLIQAVTMTVLLLLLMGLAGHNLYRYTWLWYGAFQAIAISGMKNFAVADLSTKPDSEDETTLTGTIPV